MIEESAATESGAQSADAASAMADAAPRMLVSPDLASWLPPGLQPYWEFLATYPIVMLPLLVLAGWALGKGLQVFLTRFVRQLTRRTPSRFDDDLVVALKRPVLPTTVVLAMLAGINYLNLPDFLNNLTIRLLFLVMLILWTGSAMRVAHIMLEILSANRERFTIVQPRTIPAFDMTLKILVVGAATYLFMLIWGINPTAWLASAGVLGIAVGFAARDTLANFFSGIFIIADAPYKIGDYIILDTGERGMVKQVGMRSTRLLTRDDIEITVPNAVMGNAKITNESGGPWLKERIRIPIGVAYGSDVDHVEAVLERIAREHPETVKQPVPRVRMRSFGPSSLDFEVLAWIEHPELRGKVVHELNKAIYKGLQEAGIQIPFPQSDVHIRSMPPRD